MTPVWTRARAGFALLACAGALVACGAVPAGGGLTLEQAQAKWGEPRARYTLASGQRLFYRLQAGELESLDFDADNRLVSRQQVFTLAHFQALGKGRWDASDVQREFGPPLRVSNQGESGSMWTYSWLEFGAWRLARVHLDAAGVVRSVDFVADPHADDRYR